MVVTLDGKSTRFPLRRVDGEWQCCGTPVSVWRERPTGTRIAHPERLELTHADITTEEGTAILLYALHDDDDDQAEDQRILRVHCPMDHDRWDAWCEAPILAEIVDTEDGGEPVEVSFSDDWFDLGEITHCVTSEVRTHERERHLHLVSDMGDTYGGGL